MITIEKITSSRKEEISKELFKHIRDEDLLFVWQPWLPEVDEFDYWKFNVVALEDGEVAWYIQCSSWGTGWDANLQLLYVFPAYRKKGVWATLIEHAQQYYTRLWYKILTVSVFDHNIPMQNLMDKLGFEHVGTRTKDRRHKDKYWSMRFYVKELY